MTTPRYTSNYISILILRMQYRSQDVAFQWEIGLYFALKSTTGMDRTNMNKLRRYGSPQRKHILLMEEILHHLGCIKPGIYIYTYIMIDSPFELVQDFCHQQSTVVPKRLKHSSFSWMSRDFGWTRAFNPLLLRKEAKCCKNTEHLLGHLQKIPFVQQFRREFDLDFGFESANGGYLYFSKQAQSHQISNVIHRIPMGLA